MKAAHDRRQKLHLVQLIELTHAKDPAALQAKWLAELNPQAVESPFDRLWRQAVAERDARR